MKKPARKPTRQLSLPTTARPQSIIVRPGVVGAPKKLVAFSGGKDSTAVAYGLRDSDPSLDFELLYTPTGNELPEVWEHINRVRTDLDVNLIIPRGPSLAQIIDAHDALPNWRMRFCTRETKIIPCIAFLKAHPGSTLYVGLRADEEEREGLYGDYAIYRYPLREWKWGIKDVLAYLKAKGIRVPKRTDCAVCYYQKLSEWYDLWRNYPEEFARGEAWEAQTGYTFRSPGRDTWPAALTDLRKEFESGRKIRGLKVVRDEEQAPCRVCRF